MPERKPKVLIVDDDEIVLFVSSRQLTKYGFDAVTSATAKDILALADRHAPDVILMDHSMPVVSGVEATRLLKAHDSHWQIPVIYHSSNIQIAELALEAGADAYMSKWKSIEELMILIRQMVRE